MSTFDLVAANAILKEFYPDDKVPNMAAKKFPLYSMMKKETDHGGEYSVIPTQYGNGQGASNTFANAQANQGSPALAKFLMALKPDYALATISHQLLRSTKGNSKAFLDASKLHVDGAVKVATERAARAMYRSGTGSIGRIASITSGVITLSNSSDAANFSVGQVLQCTNGTTDGNTPRAAKGYVAYVNRGLTAATSTIGVAQSAGGAVGTNPTSWTTDEYVLMDGDSNASCSGLAAWLPTTAPTSTSFYGVDRSVDSKLGGLRTDQSGVSIQEGLINAASFTGELGGAPDHAFVNFRSYTALQNALGAKVNYVDAKGAGAIGFRAIQIEGPKGPIDVIPDPMCPATLCYLLQMDTWAMISAGASPALFSDADDLVMLRVSNADSYEVRVGGYWNVRCNAPGWNTVVTLSQ